MYLANRLAYHTEMEIDLADSLDKQSVSYPRSGQFSWY